MVRSTSSVGTLVQGPLTWMPVTGRLESVWVRKSLEEHSPVRLRADGLALGDDFKSRLPLQIFGP